MSTDQAADSAASASLVPPALRTLARALGSVDRAVIPRHFAPQPGDPRAAVLVLLSDDADPILPFTVRSASLRHHSGQISFPGGHEEPSDGGLIGTALREASEEVRLDSAKVNVLGRLPLTELPVSRLAISPVVGWWHDDDTLVAQPAEVDSIEQWSISQLTDPAHRVSAQLGPGTIIGPAWEFGDLFLWGFTALITDVLLRLGGWEKPWDRDRLVQVPPRFRDDVIER